MPGWGIYTPTYFTFKREVVVVWRYTLLANQRGNPGAVGGIVGKMKREVVMAVQDDIAQALRTINGALQKARRTRQALNRP